MPAIKRGGVDIYFPLTDNTLVEYDFDKCVFEKDSEYQNVKIMHSNQYGNVLILDDDVSKYYSLRIVIFILPCFCNYVLNVGVFHIIHLYASPHHLVAVG